MTYTLVGFSALLALIYGAHYCHRPASIPRSVIKTVPVALLALAAALTGAPLLLIAALALSALGDFALSREGTSAFLLGLGNFALAHVAYFALFITLAEGMPQILTVLVLAAFALTTEKWLAPHTDELRWPVRIYVMLIAMMAAMATALPAELWPVTVGVIIFIASDTLLAVQMFRMAPLSRWHRPVSITLWGLYYAAQGLICLALIA